MKRPSASSAPSPSATARLAAALAPLRARWAALSPRERHLSSLAGAAVGLLLVWAIALAPALASLEKSRNQRLLLDAQLQQMLALQAEARQLAAQPRIGRDAALKALRESVAGLGSGAQLQLSGDRIVVSLQGVPAAALAGWLGQARTNARAVPVEVKLVRSPARAAAPAATPATAAAARGNQPSRIAVALPPPGAPGAPTSPQPLPDYAQNAVLGPPPGTAAATAGAAAPDLRWDGSVVMMLPAA